MRRSGRQSARGSSPIHSGPTVTASGRQVRSRATGTYGETLHSGQTIDRASPTTGEYIRSDVSEEPRQGRSTRTGNRSGGSHLNRELDSEGDDDATSWDGGDEEEEADQMDVDENDEDDLAGQSPEEEQEPQTLVVTLHYRKNPSNISNERQLDPSSLNGTAHQTDVLMADLDAPPQLKVSAAVASAQPASPPPNVTPTAIPTGFPDQNSEPSAAPKVEHQKPILEANNLPKLDGFFSAATPPYSAPGEAPKQEQSQFPQRPSYSATVPPAAQASNWQ